MLLYPLERKALAVFALLFIPIHFRIQNTKDRRSDQIKHRCLTANKTQFTKLNFLHCLDECVVRMLLIFIVILGIKLRRNSLTDSIYHFGHHIPCEGIICNKPPLPPLFKFRRIDVMLACHLINPQLTPFKYMGVSFAIERK